MSNDKKMIFYNYWRALSGGEIPEQEYNFDASIGRKHRFDFAWPDKLVAVEINGNAWSVKGGGRHGKDDDLEKMNIAVTMGWKVYQFSPKMLSTDPERWITMVKRAVQ